MSVNRSITKSEDIVILDLIRYFSEAAKFGHLKPSINAKSYCEKAYEMLLISHRAKL